MAGRTGHRVVEADLRQHGAQVVDVHSARRTARRSARSGAGVFEPGLLVEFDAELGRPLEDVEELAERQEQQRGDHRDRVQNRQEAVRRTAQPFLRYGQRQAGDGNREEQDDRQEVHAELLQRAGALVRHPAPERERDARQHQQCRDVQAMKEQPRGHRVEAKEPIGKPNRYVT